MCVPLLRFEGSISIPVLHDLPSVRAVFIDRDGVINQNRTDYVKNWSEFQFLDRALSALARLAGSDFKVVVISNQSAIGRRLITRETVEEIHARMLQQIVESGGRVDQILYCPHRPEDNCPCRKPRPGLLIQARCRSQINLSSSYMVGDSLEDIKAGMAVGCSAILVLTGRGKIAREKLDEFNGCQPTVVGDLADAVGWILRHEQALRNK